MLKKFLMTLSALSAAVGFFVILGTVGSAEFNVIDFETSIARSVIGLVILVIGITGTNLFSTDKNFF